MLVVQKIKDLIILDSNLLSLTQNNSNKKPQNSICFPTTSKLFLYHTWNVPSIFPDSISRMYPTGFGANGLNSGPLTAYNCSLAYDMPNIRPPNPSGCRLRTNFPSVSKQRTRPFSLSAVQIKFLSSARVRLCGMLKLYGP